MATESTKLICHGLLEIEQNNSNSVLWQDYDRVNLKQPCLKMYDVSHEGLEYQEKRYWQNLLDIWPLPMPNR